MVPKARVGLLVTCLVDMMRPDIGFATLRLLEDAGCEVIVPEPQTCCGQPGYNAGDRNDALRLARKLLKEFEGFNYVVVPSGSCAGMVRVHYPTLFEPGSSERAAFEALAARTYELTSFLIDVLSARPVCPAFPGCATYHDACSGLRELGVDRQPRELLSAVPGLELREMATPQDCCGFGGSF